jgi:hypothetical protein
MLTKEQILNASDSKIEAIDIPEWGGQVFIRTISGTERDNFEQSIVKGKGTDLTNLRAKFCVLVICDESGNRIFNDNHVSVLGKKSAAALDRIFDAGRKLNGMTDGDVKELEKNSGAIQPGDSTSD